MNEFHISAFLLERYHLGEVTPQEKLAVEDAIAHNEEIAGSLRKLETNDEDFRRRYPKERFFFKDQDIRRVRRVPPLVWGICAAAAVLVIALPLFILRNPLTDRRMTQTAEYTDRMKGASADGSSIELNVYLKGNTYGESVRLADQSGISAGNTVQLAYRVYNDELSGKYGVIFSIDGRSAVTLHFPYNMRQNTQLVSGKAVPLDEAYTLDDAPDYEIFFFVADNAPMEVREILNTARQLALQIKGNPDDALKRGTEIFDNYEVKIFTLRKD
ncbi:MAG: hypothetical protein LBQ89_03440 [Treponema sp.]|jgi:hypothetical protein|nr:hypothetical protein [Treponema sp.]